MIVLLFHPRSKLRKGTHKRTLPGRAGDVIDVQRTRECVRHLCNASRIETKVVPVSRIVEHIGGAKAHFTDQTDGSSPASRDWRT